MREWVLLNPGPANTSATVRQALVMPDLCHREPECFEMMRSVRERLVRLSGGGEDFSAVLLTGSGTAGVEAVLASAVPPEGALLVVDNGVYVYPGRPGLPCPRAGAGRAGGRGGGGPDRTIRRERTSPPPRHGAARLRDARQRGRSLEYPHHRSVCPPS